MDDDKCTLEEQIVRLFSTYTSSKITKDVIERIKSMLKEQMQEVIEQTVKRSIFRDSFSNQLEEKDLLSVVEKMGPKYKTAIGYHLIKRQHGNRDGSMGVGMDDEEATED